MLHGHRYVAKAASHLHKTIDVRGALEVHGRPVSTVMRLAADAAKGATTLRLAQPLKCEASCRAGAALGWRAGIGLREGIVDSYDWYRQHGGALAAE